MLGSDQWYQARSPPRAQWPPLLPKTAQLCPPIAGSLITFYWSVGRLNLKVGRLPLLARSINVVAYEVFVVDEEVIVTIAAARVFQ